MPLLYLIFCVSLSFFLASGQAPKIIPESCYWRANDDLEPHSKFASHMNIGTTQRGIPNTYSQDCKCKIVKRRRKRTPSVNFASLIDNGVLCVGDKASYVNKRLKKVSKEGRITREGIQCGCCSKVYNISLFEAHAGSSNHRPAANILLDDGRRLMDLPININKDASV